MFHVDPASPVPLYAQLDCAIRAAIASRALRRGDRLPTVRQLAVDLRVNANTVARVYTELERAGILATRRGAGTFVDDPTAIVTSGRDRDRALRGIADRALADLSTVGASPGDLIRHLQQRSRETR
jgi:GntR family transcriptional regulator